MNRETSGSPTAAQSLHHFLDESGLRLIVALHAANLLATHSLVPGAPNAARKVSIGVLKLRLGGCGWSCVLQAPALAFGRNSGGGVWAVARLPGSALGWRRGRGLRGV